MRMKSGKALGVERNSELIVTRSLYTCGGMKVSR